MRIFPSFDFDNLLPAVALGKRLFVRIRADGQQDLDEYVEEQRLSGAFAMDADQNVVLQSGQAEALQAMEGIQTDGAVTSEQLIRTCLKKLAAQ